MKVIYKIIDPNGKIYIVETLPIASTTSATPATDLLQRISQENKRKDFTIRREILWESETATDTEVSCKEVEYILAFRSNDLAIGYNRWPKLKCEPIE